MNYVAQVALGLVALAFTGLTLNRVFETFEYRAYCKGDLGTVLGRLFALCLALICAAFVFGAIYGIMRL